MTLLYGDSSPFPLGESFLDTLEQITIAAVKILRVYHRSQNALVETRQAEAEADRDVEWLDALERDLMECLGHDSNTKPSSTAEQETRRIVNCVKTAVDQGRERITARRTAQSADLDAILAKHHVAVEDVVERFLLDHELPESAWNVSWRYVEPRVAADVVGVAPCGIRAAFRVELPPDHRWSRPVRVNDVIDEPLEVETPTRSKLKRRGRLKYRKRALSRLLITAVERAPDRCRVRLQRRPGRRGGGVEITASADGVVIEDLNDPKLTAHPTGDQEAALVRLVEAVESDVLDLTRLRAEVIKITARDTPLEDVKDVAGLARLLIRSIAPYVRELVLRSPVRNELSLKRDLGGRRREEIFVSTRELVDKIASLPPRLQTAFEPFGPPFYRGGVAERRGTQDSTALVRWGSGGHVC